MTDPQAPSDANAEARSSAPSSVPRTLVEGRCPREQLGEPDLQLMMLSQPRLLVGARELVNAIAVRVGFDQLNAGQMSLAVDEALANVIRHGYEKRPDGRVWISAWLIDEEGPDEPAGVHLLIEDEAKQVAPETIKSRDLEDVRPGGLGVYIISQIMDVSRFECREGPGMRLVMTKFVGPPSP